MPRRQHRKRVHIRCDVAFDRLDRRVEAESEDISKRGVFVRTDELLPVGDIVELHIRLPGDVEFLVISRVAHLLSPSVARALGRHTGMGFEFLDHDRKGRADLAGYLDDLVEEFTPPPREIPSGCQILLADSSEPLLGRLRTSLTEAGFEVDVVDSGAEAYRQCSESPPNVLIASTTLPGPDGFALTRMLHDNPRTRAVQIMLMGEDASDMTRLEAYRLGVADFLHKPFTDEELIIRLRRLAVNNSSAPAGGATLRGDLSEISLATLLSLLEFERKSGILVMLRGERAVRLFVANGSVVKIEGPVLEEGAANRGERADAVSRLMDVLDWTDGNFEFTRCDVVGSNEVQLSTARLLLEHARRCDEAGR